ncbi:MAG TPA: acyl-CoA dehydrogenase family protein [Myxococcota bacterium]|nr:acyl-CoA dehydrogenase family protein [Myxococcota bacterium]
MFDFDPGDELSLLVETVRGFAAEALAPRLREHEAARDVSQAAREAARQIGLAGLELPEKRGGAGQGALARALVNEELAAADPGAALALDPLGPALYALAECGGDDALRELALPLLAQPGARAVLFCAGDAALRFGGERVSGRAPWVPADRADLVVVLDAAGACAIREGIALAPLRGAGLRAAGASELVLEGAPVAARWSDAAAAARALARARLYVAALLVGTLRNAAEFSRRYALERVAFGRPIAHHQALAFLIVDMHMAVDAARLLLHEAAWRADQGMPFEGEAAAAFADAVEASRLVGPAAVQILGGHGFMQDYPMEKSMREARALGLLCGGLDRARDDAASRLAGPVALSAGEHG